jgi:3-oxoacyl-[acyl-carrier protein] reductase
MDLLLSGKRAVVLASTSGLGLAVARALLAEGASVAICGRDAGRLESALRELRALGQDRVLGERVDVTDARELEGFLRLVRERFGTLHILVTNSGGPPPASAAEVALDSLDRAYHTTLRAAVHAIQIVLPWMRAQRFGRILGMTSSSVRQPIPGLALSNSLRAGLTGYLKTLAGEVAREGVLCNTICTGMFATERLEELFRARAARSGRTLEQERDLAKAEIPVGRIGDPEEFGAMAAFMVSERASFLNGVALAYDGGASRFLL